jgi:N-hydroxyarylamine O-acetyltransferase
MLLAVETEGERWLSDVGFGGDGLLFPIPLRPGESNRQFDWEYRLVQEGGAYVLQSIRPEGWLDLYAFTLEPQEPADYQVANWYTSTHPSSAFRSMLRVQLPGPETRLMLVNRTLTETTLQGSRETGIADDTDLLEVLKEKFGLCFPEGTHIPLPEAAKTV